MRLWYLKTGGSYFECLCMDISIGNMIMKHYSCFWGWMYSIFTNPYCHGFMPSVKLRWLDIVWYIYIYIYTYIFICLFIYLFIYLFMYICMHAMHCDVIPIYSWCMQCYVFFLNLMCCNVMSYGTLGYIMLWMYVSLFLPTGELVDCSAGKWCWGE